MKRILAIVLAIVCHATALGEVVVDFDGKTWQGIGEGADFKQRVLNEGLCFVADDGSKVGEVLKGLDLHLVQPHSLRLAVRGAEGRGAMIDSGKELGAKRLNTIVVTCEPEGVTVTYLNPTTNAAMPPQVMDVDFEGVAGFLKVVKEGVDQATSQNERPLAVVAVRSNCSYGLLVKVLQLIRAGGCRNALIKVDDEFPGLNVEVKQDIKMNLPGVDPAAAEQRGRITINLRNDGSITDGDGKVLASDEEIKAHITRQRDAFAMLGKQPVLFLRGEKETVFARSRRVINLGSEVEVNSVIFATYAKPED